MCACRCIAYRVAGIVHEVDFGKSHVNNQYFHAHNAALVAVLVLGDNGHLGFSCSLERLLKDRKILLQEVLEVPKGLAVQSDSCRTSGSIHTSIFSDKCEYATATKQNIKGKLGERGRTRSP